MESPAPPLPRRTSPGSSKTAGSNSPSSAHNIADNCETRPLSDQNQAETLIYSPTLPPSVKADLAAGESPAPPVPQLQVPPPPEDYFHYLNSYPGVNEQEAKWMENMSDYIDVPDHNHGNEPWLKYFFQHPPLSTGLINSKLTFDPQTGSSSESSQMISFSGLPQGNNNGEASSQEESQLWDPIQFNQAPDMGYLPMMLPFINAITGMLMDPFAATPSHFPQDSNNDTLKPGSENPSFNWLPEANAAESTTVPSSSSSSLPRYDEKAEDFKKFDTIEDCFADHYYFKIESSTPQPKNWAIKVQEEWGILQNDLPENVFVRVSETRMDLLRVAIIGAQGTPYYDGIFFFDISFPNDYPNVPPMVHYYSGGLRINPNLYQNGYVCLSLLNTWMGTQKELWIPGVSTMLQVLVSIQALILNANPYFNEPGCRSMEGTPQGDKMSSEYNEKIFFHSLQTMVYTMKRPPKHFEELVFRHFRRRAHRILMTCRAYMEGADVGGADAGAQRSCSENFREILSGFMETVVDCFKRIGVQDCDKFLPPPPPTLALAPNELPASE